MPEVTRREVRRQERPRSATEDPVARLFSVFDDADESASRAAGSTGHRRPVLARLGDDDRPVLAGQLENLLPPFRRKLRPHLVRGEGERHGVLRDRRHHAPYPTRSARWNPARIQRGSGSELGALAAPGALAATRGRDGTSFGGVDAAPAGCLANRAEDETTIVGGPDQIRAPRRRETPCHLEQFLDRVGAPVAFDRPLALETETADERDAINTRLRRLATDRRLRARYQALLAETWETYADIWQAEGQGRMTATAEAWTRRLVAGTNALDLLPDRHIARRDSFPQRVRTAHRDGTLWLTPTMAGYGHILALPDLLSVSTEARSDPAVLRREVATEIADSLRVLSDPTRLTILAQLAETPATVSEIARTLHLAQPTASVHVRQLREAGLVAGDRDGARTVYTVEPATLQALLASVSERLAETMSPTRTATLS